jgi:hypothetical protein
LESASIDMQITTAKKYPRDIGKVKQKMLSMACLDDETAEACFYTLKRKDKDGKQKLIQGPSIRLAEIAATAYGNIRSGARCISNNGKTVVCQGVCHDLENNVFYSMESSRRITTREGKTFGDDMQVVTTNACSAIALRNAITKAVPLALIKPVLEAAKKVAVGDVKSLSAKREKVISRLKQMGASQDSILAAVECSTVDDVTLDKLEILIGLGTALKEGETTLEEAFPPVGGKLHSAGAKQEAATETAQAQPAEPEPNVTPQDKLASWSTEAGYSWDELHAALLNIGLLTEPVKSFADIPDDVATRAVRAQKGLLSELQKGREGK